MSENNLTITTLHDLLDVDGRKFISAEVQLKKVLPHWINMASSIKLKNVFQRYLDFVEQHIENMQTFYEEEHINSLSLHNKIMEAFIEEAEDKLKSCSDAAVKDACLLAGVQSINHFKISIYGTAAAFADLLSLEKTSVVFHQASVNEKQIDDRLTQLAQYEINSKAKAPIELTA
jgi:ferritin-like metal-binding protein YciE